MTINTERPKVSIVMSFHNEPLQWIRLAVESLIEQTFKDFELIIVCDNPDNSEGISYISSLEDSRIRFTINPKNLGPTKSFNIGIAAASGEYIARMDTDDICLPERLERQVSFLDSHPDISVCATDTHTIDKDGKIIRHNRYKHKRDIALMFISNCISHPSVMFRRSLLEVRNPIYNEEYIYSQDYELWQFLLLKGYKIHTLNQVLLLYRKHKIQISSARKAKQVELFKRAHRSFINNWLLDRNIIQEDDCNDLKAMLRKASAAYSASDKNDERRQLAHIIYVIYYSLGTLNRKYRLAYLADRNLIAFRIKFILTFRLLFSGEKRVSRSGLV